MSNQHLIAYKEINMNGLNFLLKIHWMENNDKNIPDLVLSIVLEAKIIRGKHQAPLPLAAVFFPFFYLTKMQEMLISTHFQT